MSDFVRKLLKKIDQQISSSGSTFRTALTILAVLLVIGFLLACGIGRPNFRNQQYRFNDIACIIYQSEEVFL